MRISEHNNGRGRKENPPAAAGATIETPGNGASLPVGTLTALSELGRTALELAEHGYHVLPCSPRGKVPLLPKAHPAGSRCTGECGRDGHGVYDASTDPNRIAQWWLAYPEANPAIACGPSGLVVLDGDEAGEFGRLCADLGHDLPQTHQVSTSKGEHRWFRQPPLGRIGNPRGLRDRGYEIDVRGDGGYVMAPGAVHETGVVYTGSGPVPDPATLPQVPSWAVEALGRSRSAQPVSRTGEPLGQRGAWAALTYEVDAVLNAKPGERNNRLRDASANLGQIVGAGAMDEQTVRHLLTSAAVRNGLTESEVAATIEHNLTKGMAEGRPMATPEDELEDRIRDALERLRVHEAARQRLAAEGAKSVQLPELVSLDRLLAETPDTTPWILDRLWKRGGKVLNLGGKKSGKTVLTGNLVRSLVGGSPFLDEFEVNAELVGRLYVADFEMSRDQLRDWYRDWSVDRPERVSIDPLRGLASTFDVRVPAVRKRWADRIRGNDTVIVDPLAPILAALGIEENSNGVAQFLEALDELMREAGASQYLVTHHMGWEDTRARGHSSLEGWPDGVWYIRRDRSEDPTEDDYGSRAPRFFSAEGRDIDVPEGLLTFDGSARRLAYQGGTTRAESRQVRGQVADLKAILTILRVVSEHPDVSAAQIDSELGRGFKNGRKPQIRGRAEADGLIRNIGRTNAKRYLLTEKGRAWLESEGEPPQGELDYEPDLRSER